MKSLVFGAAVAAGLLLGFESRGDAIYLKPLGASEERTTVDGASWATAFADVASAAAAAGATPIYAAQGMAQGDRREVECGDGGRTGRVRACSPRRLRRQPQGASLCARSA